MPMGKENPGTGRDRPSSELMVLTKKPLYLKMPKRPRFSTKEEITARLALGVPRYFSAYRPWK